MNPFLPDFPPAGSSVSFSAGTKQPNPGKWRLVQPDGAEKLACLLSRFPDLLADGPAPSFLINAYPAQITPPGQLVFVDSYGRWQTFCGALAFAASQGGTCLITSMPLTLAHLILRALRQKTIFPKHLVLLMGGYYCPQSLELFILDLLQRAHVTAKTLHLYGVGEINAGLLAAQRTADSPGLLFHSVDPSWQPVVVDSLLHFRHTAHPSTVLPTDDHAEMTERGIRLLLSDSRLSPNIRGLLESWPRDMWAHRTGFLAHERGRIVFQCRPGNNPIAARDEYEHFDFCRRFGHSWLDKPDWGDPA